MVKMDSLVQISIASMKKKHCSEDLGNATIAVALGKPNASFSSVAMEKTYKELPLALKWQDTH